MTNQSRNGEHGVALLFSLLALLLLTAITASLIMLSATETSVNYNYRTEEIAFFAAKAGIYEALDRMQQSNANSIAAQIPTSVPSATGGVLYIINAGSSLTVKPWDTTNAYYDDELCHEGYTIAGMSSAPPDVPCTTLPTGSTWYKTVTSNYPWSGTSAAMPYEWVRINWKVNSSQSYLSGGTTPTASTYSVDSASLPGSASTQVCWNGGSEVLLGTPTGVTPAYTSCEQYQSCGATQPSLGTPVLLITALAITSNGSRQMVQAEAALNPPSISVSPCGISDPYGFFAYGSSCTTTAFTLGGGAVVDGYNSSKAPGTYLGTKSNALGSVGTNGGLLAQGTSTKIGGTVYVPDIGSPPGPGSCPVDFNTTGGATYGGLKASTTLATPIVSIPPNTGNPDITVKANTTWPPNTNYNNVKVQTGATLTLTAPGTYNFNCLSVGSGSTLAISPASKMVTINITGTSCTAGNAIDFSSGASINNTSGVAANLQFNYPGTGGFNIVGGPSAYAVVNAPSAAVKLNGGSDFYGTIMGNTIDDHGGVNLHFDAADKTLSGAPATTDTATATGSYNSLSYHSLPY